MKRRLLTLTLFALLATFGTTGCSDDGSGGTKADQKTSNLVAQDVASVTKQVGDQAGAQAGKADVGVSGESLTGSIPGSAGAVDVSGSVKAGASGFDIISKLAFNGYKGQGGVAVSGTITATYQLVVDVSNPLAPSIKFSSSVKGTLTTADGQVVTIDMGVSADQGKLTCSGGANGYALASDCGGSGTPAPDMGNTPAPDMGSTPAPDQGSTPVPDLGNLIPDIGGLPDFMP